MHRQSLGSPGSKHHSHGGFVAKEDGLVAEDQKRKDEPSSLADEDKSQKPYKSPARPERLVHIIPLLTVLCFLVLYLSSHDPSQKDLALFNGFKRPSMPTDSTGIDDVGRILEIEKGDVLAIRSLRNLQEIGRQGAKAKHRLHRKIGDF
ncbi:uncharacterized protein LOC127812587 [Diospyros lotus]|uniref:uncharacterized protein LOC127812587 n=1 Tax=Diospyros lotus TaxID=55363 RepID=UPI002258EC72|nr:uncharacterized protein LOC127812587 [Diospyros lotus]